MAVLKYIKLTLPMMLASLTFYAPASVSADELDGAKIYQQHCASCHGEKLEGGIGSSFLNHIWNYGSHPQLIGMNIKFGIPNLEMPGFKEILNDEQIGTVVAYIVEQDAKSELAAPKVPDHIKTEHYNFKVDILADNIPSPWGIAFIDANKALITEQSGKLYLMLNGVVQKDVIKDTPNDIALGGQGGLLDVALDPDYGDNGWIYLSYSHGLGADGILSKAKVMTRVVRGRIRDGHWVDQQVIFQADEKFYSKSRGHFGSRFTFDEKGRLYFSVGDRRVPKQAQDLSRPNGKIHRINKDGTIPEDNPFVGRPGALPSIFTYGNRNPQGMATHPETGDIWSAEHGPMGGDELNHIRAGKNYGWPEITYGVNYNGTIISEFTAKAGMEQPIIHWTPSIAVADIDFYNNAILPKWQNNLLVSSLKYRDLRRLVIEGDKVTHREMILKGLGRIRSVTVSPSGAIYLLLEDPSLILRLTPES